MPPKRASNRRSGATPRSGGALSYLGGSSPAALNPILPNVPTKQSMAYGSPAAADMPRNIAAKPNMGLAEMADTIDMARWNARDRDLATAGKSRNQPRTNSRSQRRSESIGGSPVRRRRREPTPDQMQLLDSLRDVTVSPNPGDNASRPGRSTPTPTPPIPHTLSAASSPAPGYPSLPTNPPLYPSPLLRLGSPTQRAGLPFGSSPQHANSMDNESLISWGVERDIHEDDLQRTRSRRFGEEPHGKNISQPPRRPSGLAIAHETIEEEEEPESEIITRKLPSPSPEPSPEPQIRPQPEPEPEPEREPEPKPAPQAQPQTEPEFEPEPEPQREPEPEQESQSRLRSSLRSSTRSQREHSTAPAKTIIPQSTLYSTSFRDSISALSERSFEAGRSISNFSASSLTTQRTPILRTALIVLLTILSLSTAYFFSDEISTVSHDIASSLPFGKPKPYIPLDASGMEAVRHVASELSRLGAQVTSLSREVDYVKTEVDSVPAPTTVIEAIPDRRETPIPRINFLSIGSGAIVVPGETSPTWGDEFKWSRWVYSWFESDYRGPPPPLAALTAWEDVGDCWCSPPIESGMSQLSILLGKPIVPEDVVVEHIPKGAALDPGLAPQEMELWARFVIKPDEAITSDIHETIMNHLKLAYRDEPESAYSDDENLGSSFYRIGRWKYDINRENHIQEFSMDLIFDSDEIGVDKVVFRVKSNWGADATCLYRLKLYGHD